MRRSLVLRDRWYSGRAVRSAWEVVQSLADGQPSRGTGISGEVGHEEDRWYFEEPAELFDAIDNHPQTSMHVSMHLQGIQVWLFWHEASRHVNLSVEAESRDTIAAALEPFLNPQNFVVLPPEPEPDEEHRDGPRIFIGHGGSPAWRDLRDQLADKHGYAVEAFESGARAGHHIRDILEGIAARTTFAILVFTAEDQQKDETWRARQNVVHEAGLFQGALGFKRAIVLLEEGVQTFSNLDGIQWIGFPTGHIQSTFGEVLATLRREFGDAR